MGADMETAAKKRPGRPRKMEGSIALHLSRDVVGTWLTAVRSDGEQRVVRLFSDSVQDRAIVSWLKESGVYGS